MGNDGGSIPHRTEVVKQKKKEERKDQYELAKSKANYCALSKEPLKKPLAVCRLGYLYNKEELIKRLIEKKMPLAFNHIRRVRDFKEVTGVQQASEGGTLACPVSGAEFNGFNKFYFVWCCGCLLADEAIKELKMKDKCINCGKEYEEGDLVNMN